MAAEGTTIPGDAGKMNLIPSVPRPDQIEDSNELGSTDVAGAADNATDIPRVCIHCSVSRQLETLFEAVQLRALGLESHY